MKQYTIFFGMFIVYLLTASPGYTAEPYFERFTIQSLGDSYDIICDDFNEDGSLDLAIPNRYFDDYYISFFWGDQTGLFPSRYDKFHNGLRPNAIKSGDFDRDNNLDIVVPNTLEHTVGTYLGNGDGSFGVYKVTNTGYYPTYLAVDLLNGDAYEDVILSSWVYGKVYSFLGNGDGTFQSVAEYDVGGGTSMILTAAFYEDGNTDFIVSNMAYNDVVTMFGQGDGTFYGMKSLDVGYDAFAIAVPDLDGDSHVDIVCGTKHSLVTFLGDGFGGFTLQQSMNYQSPGVKDIEPFDADKDGHVDIACSFTYNDRLRIYRGDGSGRFSNHRLITGISSPLGITSGDFNSDGHTDLAVSSSETDSVTIFLNQWGVLSLNLIPPVDPDVAIGSSISFEVIATNSQDTTVTADVWLVASREPGGEIRVPSSIIDGPVNPSSFELAPGQEIHLNYTIIIPLGVPTGYYKMFTRSGYYSKDLMSERFFEGNILEN